MQSDQHWYFKRERPPLTNQGANDHSRIPVTSAYTSALSPVTEKFGPSNSVEFQPSDVCPRNFIIFDHTDNRSQIMFHPTMVHKFTGPAANIYAEYVQENFVIKEENNEEREKLSMQEDSNDINALLSFEDEEREEYEEEEVSTGSSHWNYGSMPLEYGSEYLKSSKKKASSSSQKSSSRRSSCNGNMKGEKMKKMVKALREIVPGGDQMNTADVLDEAVKYLKSLKVEVQKLGFED